MSDDRFKRARQSLMQNPQQQPSFPNYEDDPEEATALVDLASLQAGAAALQNNTSPQFAPPPNYDFDDDGADATELVSMAEMFPGPPATGPGSLPANPSLVIGNDTDYTDDHEASTQFVNVSELQAGASGYNAAPPAAAGGFNEDATQMVDINSFTAPNAGMGQGMGAAPVTDHSSTSEGSTQFIDLNALAAGNLGASPGYSAPPHVTPIDQDAILTGSYTFSPGDIQQFGQYTLVFAHNNATNQSVVLKRVWEGSPHQMPEWLRTRVSQLGQIVHPKLASMNGLFASDSGAWVELERPAGTRMTYLLQQNLYTVKTLGPILEQVTQAIQAIHGYQLLYGNLTTDAIWIDEAGHAKIEPFDVLAFEERGDLGPFGAPELQEPAETRPVTPATDVYSMGVVIITALRGSPDIGLASQLGDKKLEAAVQTALDPSLMTRPQDFSGLLEGLGAGGKFNPKMLLDKKFLLPATVLAVVLLMGTLFLDSGGAPKKAAAPQDPGAASATPEVTEKKELAKAPGELTNDPRLVVEQSWRYNPPDKVEVAKASTKELAKAEALLKEAKDDFAKAPKYASSQKAFRDSMKKTVRAIRLRGGEGEEKLFQKMIRDKRTRKIQEEVIKNVEDGLREQDISRTLIRYRSLYELDPNANALGFFEKNNQPNFKIVPSKTPAKK